ncbi:MAG: phenylacetate-CoA oxygenase subunit PaaI [Proteobacteria bacterium]|nr:MAG: phenylacetate-CoA oxygenase subunit PaaI [Pseudomonadota bacterium]
MANRSDLDASLCEYLLRLGDNTLILAQRLSEWCGHGPVLEEDLALTNISLDLIGQTQLWLGLAGEIEGRGRDADALAFRRDAWDFHNALITELPVGDFARTSARQFLFDHWHFLLLRGLSDSADERVAAGAAKSLKEVRYHVERSDEWMRLLGDGTDESHRRTQQAIDELWPYTGELFESDDHDRVLATAGIAIDPGSLLDEWRDTVGAVLARASIRGPENGFMHSGGRRGVHTEHLGFLLAQMQFLQRAYPDAAW